MTLESTQIQTERWTHDPMMGGSFSTQWHHGMEKGDFVEGWSCLTARVSAPRCGLCHPSDMSAYWGSCGAEPNHEHPHVWSIHNWHVMTVSRRRKVAEALKESETFQTVTRSSYEESQLVWCDRLIAAFTETLYELYEDGAMEIFVSPEELAEQMFYAATKTFDDQWVDELMIRRTSDIQSER